MTEKQHDERATDYGYDDQYQYMRICGTCFELYGAGRPDGMEQQCACRTTPQERWPRHDFNQRATLCRCCGYNVLHSGSRWSQYFCRECQLLAMGVSVWNRRLVFPIGRHSLMHTFVPNTPSPSLAAARRDPDAVAEGINHALQGIVKGSDGLQRWYKTNMRRNLKHFGLQGEVSLPEYMNAVAAESPALRHRITAFDGLCRLFAGDPPATVRSN